MKTFTHVFSLKKYLTHKREDNLNIAFVPTMGALHEGHLTLIKKAMETADIVVCSIFVNPTQFNNADDLEKYPRTTDADKKLLKSVGCHVLFLPSVEEIYPEGFTAPSVDLGGLELVMEGANRPGHFEGVVEVVSRLFDIVQPDKALFGEKDFQQLAILRRMTTQLKYPIDIIGVPIVREESGLAMSSRNQRLSEEAKRQATFLHNTLLWVEKAAKDHSPQEIKQLIKEKFDAHPQLELEYFELADNKTLQSVTDWNHPEGTRAFFVAWIEGIRLIDNMEIIDK